MRYAWRVVFVALGSVLPSAVPAQAKGSACDLLTAKEISDAIGVAVAGNGQPNDVPVSNGTAQGETMRGCAWRAGQTGTMNVSTIRAPSGEQRAAGLARMRQAYERFRPWAWPASVANAKSRHRKARARSTITLAKLL